MSNNQKILSFDIGIKNMALCLFSFDVSNQHITPFKIDSWKVLNLMNENTTPNEKCNQYLPPKSLKKSAKSTKSAKSAKNIIKIDTFINSTNRENINSVLENCQKPAKFMKKLDSSNFIENSTQYFCEKCAKKNTEFIIPKKSYQISSLKKLKIEELEKLITEFSINLRETEERKPTKKAFIELLSAFFQQKCFAPIVEPKHIAAGDTDLITIGRNMVRLLDDVPDIYAVDIVLIENQISTIAARMKSVQGMLAQYFIIRCPGAKIEFVSSANKLKGFDKIAVLDNREKQDNGEKQEKAQTFDKRVYKKHKTDGVDITKEILSKNQWLNEKISILSESKKKDDLADAFLQGIWFLKKIERIKMDGFIIS